MANITRFSPDDMFDDMLKGFFMRPMRLPGRPTNGGQSLGQIKIDVSENDQAYTVHAEVPGVRKEDLNVSIDGNQVTISAEVKREEEKKEGNDVFHSERYYGKIYRSFTLAQEVDEAGAQAKYQDGVLELTLPKKATSQAKKLTIQ